MKRSEAYNLYKMICYGYMIKNYNKSFVNRCKDNIKVVFVSPDLLSGKVSAWCKGTGNEFQLDINIVKKTIVHRGCYSKNKGCDPKEIIDFNLLKQPLPTTPTTDIGKDPLLEELRNGITAEDKKLIDDAYPDTTKLIETPSCRLLVVRGVPEDANRFHVFNDERPYLSMFQGSETPRVYLPEGQWEILGRLSEISEDWCEDLVTRQCINSDLVLFAYMDYVNKGYGFDNALESFHSLMQREGIYAENPIILIEEL